MSVGPIRIRAERPPLTTTDAFLTSVAVRGRSKRHRSISVVDGRTEEETCAVEGVRIGQSDGMVCSVQAVGGVVCPPEEGGEENGGGLSMPLAMLGDIVTLATVAFKNLYSLLDSEGGGRGAMTGMVKKNITADAGSCGA